MGEGSCFSTCCLDWGMGGGLALLASRSGQCECEGVHVCVCEREGTCVGECERVSVYVHVHVHVQRLSSSAGPVLAKGPRTPGWKLCLRCCLLSPGSWVTPLLPLQASLSSWGTESPSHLGCSWADSQGTAPWAQHWSHSPAQGLPRNLQPPCQPCGCIAHFSDEPGGWAWS